MRRSCCSSLGSHRSQSKIRRKWIGYKGDRVNRGSDQSICLRIRHSFVSDNRVLPVSGLVSCPGDTVLNWCLLSAVSSISCHIRPCSDSCFEPCALCQGPCGLPPPVVQTRQWIIYAFRFGGSRPQVRSTVSCTRQLGHIGRVPGQPRKKKTTRA